MLKASHLLRALPLVVVLAALAIGVTLSGPASPAHAAVQKFYVDDDRNVVDDGDPCVAHSVSYGACYKSISPAINDLDVVSGEQDEIWVDSGTYNEQAFINKPLKLLSINGPATTIITNNNGSAIVWIEADRVAVGGPGLLPGDGFGFTIRQNASGGAEAVHIVGPTVKGDTVTIQKNLIQGMDSKVGIQVQYNLNAGHLVFDHNEFQPAPTASIYAFLTLIDFGLQNFPFPSGAQDVSAISADIDITNNASFNLFGPNLFRNDGIVFEGSLFFSTVNIEGNHFESGGGGGPTGIRFVGDIRTFSAVTITDNQIDDIDYLLTGTNITNHSSLAISNLRSDVYRLAGIAFTGDVTNQSALSVVGSHLTGIGSADGVHVNNVSNQSMLTVSNTTLDQVGHDGVHAQLITNGSIARITDVTITAGSNDMTRGIYIVAGVSKSTLIVDPTIITGFTLAAISLGDQEEGSTVTIDGNTFTAATNGSEYCLLFNYGPNQGSHGEVTNNTCTGFGGPNAGPLTGIGLGAGDGTYFNSSWLIDNNTFTGHAAGARYGINLQYVSEHSSNTVTRNKISNIFEIGIEMVGATFDNSTSDFSHNETTALDPSGASYGMALEDVRQNSHVTNNDNTIMGFDYVGIGYYDVLDNSSLDVSRNKITAPTDGMEYGLQFDNINRQSRVTANGNEVNGWGGPNASDGYGIVLTDVVGGSSFSADGNKLNAHTDGGSYGVRIMTGVSDSSRLSLTNSTIKDFTFYAIDLADAFRDGDMTIADNNATAHSTGAPNGLSMGALYGGGVNVVVSRNTFSDIGKIGSPIGISIISLDEASTVEMDHNSVSGSGIYQGVWVNGNGVFDNGSRLKITDSTFSGVEYAGIDIGPYIDNGSLLVLLDNVFASADCNAVTPFDCSATPVGSEYGLNMARARYGSTVDLERNVFTGFGGTGAITGYGFYADIGVYEGGLLKIIGNKFYGADTGTGGPDFGIEFNTYAVEYGGDAYIQDNTVTNFDGDGIDPFNVDEGNLWVTGNTVKGLNDGAEYGIYFNNVTGGSNVQVTGNEVTTIVTDLLHVEQLTASRLKADDNTLRGHVVIGAEQCAYINAAVADGATLSFSRNNCTHIVSIGFYMKGSGGVNVDNGSIVTASGNTLAGDGDNMTYGISLDGRIQRGASGHFDGNDITGFNIGALFLQFMTDGGKLTINDNTMTGTDSNYADLGVSIIDGVENGSDAEINRNTITNVGQEGIYNYDSWYGAHVQICDNNITPGSAGTSNDGISMDYLAGGGATLDVCNNFIRDFYFNGIGGDSGSYDQGHNSISGNDISSPYGTGIGVGPLKDGTVTSIENNYVDIEDGSHGIRIDSIIAGAITTVHNNIIKVPSTPHGIIVTSDVIGNGSSLTITRNEISDFTQDGIFLSYATWGSKVLIQDNKIDGPFTGGVSVQGGSGPVGIRFDDSISNGAIGNVLNNCISEAKTGVLVTDLTDTSQLHINQNDLADLNVAIYASLVTNTVDGENNWYGSPAGPNVGTNSDVIGNVDADPALSSPPPCAGTTATPTRSPTPTPSPTGYVTVTPFVCGTGHASASPSPSPTHSPAPTTGSAATPRATRTPSVTGTPTGSASATSTTTPTATPTGTPTTSGSPSATPCASPLSVATATPTHTPTPTPPHTALPTPSPTPTANLNGPTPRSTRTPVS